MWYYLRPVQGIALSELVRVENVGGVWLGGGDCHLTVHNEVVPSAVLCVVCCENYYSHVFNPDEFVSAQ